MRRRRKKPFNEKQLTKGELRKLNMLRKSVGEQLGEETFAKWLAERAAASPRADRNAALIEGALLPLIKSKKLTIPRGGYLVQRGRGGVIVEPAKA